MTRYLDSDIDFANRDNCCPYEWDVVLTLNSWRYVDVTEVSDSLLNCFNSPAELPRKEVMEFKDYFVPMRVYRVKGYPHAMRGDGGTQDLYVCGREEYPSERTLKPFNDTDWTIWGMRILPKIVTSRDEFRAGISIMITRNGEDFLPVGATKLDYALIEAARKIHKLDTPDTPFSVSNIDFEKEIIGRAVEFRGKPGVVESYIWGQHCVIIKGPGLDVKDEILGGNIDWWPESKG